MTTRKLIAALCLFALVFLAPPALASEDDGGTLSVSAFIEWVISQATGPLIDPSGHECDSDGQDCDDPSHDDGEGG